MTTKQEQIDQITNKYFCNGGAKIRRMSDTILKKIGVFPDYPDEFYSLAGVVFIQATEKWDGVRKFDSFLYACLFKRFKSQLTSENAQKRGGNYSIVSIHQEVGEDLTLEDMIGEEQVVDRLSPEMTEYLKSLNSTQKAIYLLLVDGYEPREIQAKLGITSKVYNRELKDSRAYDKIKVLTQPTETVKKTVNKGETNLIGRNEMNHGTTTVESIKRSIKNGTLRDDNPLQRATENWNNEMKGNLIVTALNGFGIPGIVFCERNVGESYVTEIIDGLQRCSSFISFTDNAYRISKKVERPIISYQVFKGYDDNGLPVNENAEFDVRGKKFSDLPEQLQEKLLDYNITVDTYKKCSNEDVEYHIRRLNSSRSMNHSQRALTFVGTNFALMIKRISNKGFFRDTYKATDFKNGNIQRLISESVMLINFEEGWTSSPEKIGAYLNENANGEQFKEFGDMVDRVDDIIDEETRKLFTMKDSFIWFRVFSDFSSMGIADEKFNDFLANWETLKTKDVNGREFADLNTKATKDLSSIQAKIDYIEALMYEFFGEEKEEEIDIDCDAATWEFVDEFYSVETAIPVSVKNRAKVAVKTALALSGKEDLSDSSVQESLSSGELDAEMKEDAIAFTQDFVDDWLLSVKEDSSILKEEKLPALVRLYKYVVDSEIEGSRALNWFLNFVDQEEVSRKLVGNYSKDWKTLKGAFDAFLSYDKAA